MKRPVLLGCIVGLMGVALLLIGVYCDAYGENIGSGFVAVVRHPLRRYAVPFGIIGLFLIITGVLVVITEKKKKGKGESYNDAY